VPILIANIGTSDLSVRVDVNDDDYYLPIDPLDEPNLKDQIRQLLPEQQQIWNAQYAKGQQLSEHPLVKYGLYQALEFSAKPPSRHLTNVLLEQCRANPDLWRDRIKPVRILGVIEAARQLGASQGYIFVTDQASEDEASKDEPKGNEKDTLYLYELLKWWLNQAQIPFTLTPLVIQRSLDPRQPDLQDWLLNFYYETLNRIIRSPSDSIHTWENDLILVSIKGGTPQMQTALRIQAIAGIRKLVFLEPELMIDKVMKGTASSCKRVSYWRYLRTQKHQIVQQLLEQRWDFDGAREVLEDWQKSLAFLVKYEAIDDRGNPEELDRYLQRIQQVNAGLEIASHHFNLDRNAATVLLTNEANADLRQDPDLQLQNYLEHYDPLLDLYAQCQIYFELKRVADFLGRMGSFYETALNEAIVGLGGKQYLQVEESGWWKLKTELFNPSVLKRTAIPTQETEARHTLWREFSRRQGRRSRNSMYSDERFRDMSKFDFTKNKKIDLNNRFIKRNFLDALIYISPVENSISDRLYEVFKNLDFWYDARNQLVHSLRGISVDRVKEFHNTRPPEFEHTCKYERILQIMNKLRILVREQCILESARRIEQVPDSSLDGYLYRPLRTWVMQQLTRND
jgi:hypothetical protein